MERKETLIELDPDLPPLIEDEDELSINSLSLQPPFRTKRMKKEQDEIPVVNELSDVLCYVFDLNSKINPTISSLPANVIEMLQTIQQKRVPQEISKPLQSESNTHTNNTSNSSTTFSTSLLATTPQKQTGKLGSRLVSLDKKTAFGDFKIVENTNTIEGFSNFSSILASACVHSGKWMYEAFLHTSGIVQLGFSTVNTRFTNEEGIGDFKHSYAYDGNRVKKWTEQSAGESYGFKWRAGDIIGCCIDVDKGEISFHRNGVSMGVAFSGIWNKAVGAAYFPGVSISTGEKVTLNFGAAPFVYPIPGFQPFQPVEIEFAEQSYYLTSSLTKLIRFIHSQTFSLSQPQIALINGLLFSHLGPSLTNEFVVSELLCPLFENLVVNNELQSFKTLVHTLNNYLEDFEFTRCIELTLETLSMIIPHRAATMVSFSSSSNHWNGLLTFQLLLQEKSVLNCLVNHISSQKAFLILENLFLFSKPTPSDLKTIFPTMWHIGCPPEQKELSEKQILEITEALQSRALIFESITKWLWITNKDFLLMWLDWLIKKNRSATKEIPFPGVSNRSVLMNAFASFTPIVTEWMKVHPAKQFNVGIFSHDSRTNYFDFARLGGLLSHINKEFPISKEIRERLDEEQIKYLGDETVPNELTFSQNLTPISHNNNNNNNQININKTATSNFGTIGMDSKSKFFPFYGEKLFDSVAFLYSLSLTPSFKQASSYNVTVEQHVMMQKAVEEKLIKEKNDKRLNAYKEQLDEVIASNSRLFAWCRASLFNQTFFAELFHIVTYLVDLVTHCSKLEFPIFHYLPEFYLENAVDAFHCLRRSVDPSPVNLLDKDHTPGSLKFMRFLINFMNEKRIVNPDHKEFLLQSLSVLLQYDGYIELFEHQELQNGAEEMISNLLNAFDSQNKTWIAIANILSKFWRGTEFYQKNKTRGASPFLQKAFQRVTLTQPQVSEDFLNKIFNNLNYTVTEFGVFVENFTVNKATALLENVQKKIHVMFDLSHSLASVLEFMTRDTPELFSKKTKNINRARLAEIVLFILNRTLMGAKGKMFQNFLKSDELIDQAAILGPICGIFVNLANFEESKFAEALILSGGFDVEGFEFLCDLKWLNPSKQEESTSQVAPEKAMQLRKFFSELKELHLSEESKKSSVKPTESQDDDLCPICFTNDIDTIFAPCNHTSCELCIKRHLLNNKKCFFCNAEITETQPIQKN